jgi:hypothetical protein
MKKSFYTEENKTFSSIIYIFSIASLGRINKQSIHEMIMAEIRTAFRFFLSPGRLKCSYNEKKEEKSRVWKVQTYGID